jgi:hypothetical protein
MYVNLISYVSDIKMDLGEIGWDGRDWFKLAQDRDPLEGSCEHGDEPSVSLKFLGIF